MNGLLVERCYPVVCGVFFAAVWYFSPLVTPDNPRELFATLVSLASIVVGFLATAMSIIVAAPDGPVLKQLRESGYVEDLICYLREPFAFGILLLMACIAGYLMPKEVLTEYRCAVAVLIWLSTSLIAGLLRISLVFVNFLRASNLQRKK